MLNTKEHGLENKTVFRYRLESGNNSTNLNNNGQIKSPSKIKIIIYYDSYYVPSPNVVLYVISGLD